MLLGLDHGQQLLEGLAWIVQCLGHVVEHLALGRRELQVRHGGGDLDLQKHLDQVGAPMTLAPELLQHFVQGEARSLALVEQFDGRLALGIVQAHLLHDLAGQLDLLGRDPPVGLGHVTHDRKGGGKEGALNAFGLVTQGVVLDHAAQALVEVVAQGRAEQRAQRAAQHEAECATDQLAPPAHSTPAFMVCAPGRTTTR